MDDWQHGSNTQSGLPPGSLQVTIKTVTGTHSPCGEPALIATEHRNWLMTGLIVRLRSTPRYPITCSLSIQYANRHHVPLKERRRFSTPTRTLENRNPEPISGFLRKRFPRSLPLPIVISRLPSVAKTSFSRASIRWVIRPLSNAPFLLDSPSHSPWTTSHPPFGTA